jgi:hypothetical protein
MRSFNDSSRANDGIRTLFFVGCAICSMLAWLFFVPTLYGHPPTDAASGANASIMIEVSHVASALAVPTAPSGLTATTVTNSRIDLAWTDNSSDESGFKIERKTGVAGAYVEIATVGANVISFTNVSLNPSTPYFYRVRAYIQDRIQDRRCRLLHTNCHSQREHNELFHPGIKPEHHVFLSCARL